MGGGNGGIEIYMGEWVLGFFMSVRLSTFAVMFKFPVDDERFYSQTPFSAA